MTQSRKKHDIWKGSLIETFDVVSPLEPKKPPRPFEGTVDVRKEHLKGRRLQEDAEKKAKLEEKRKREQELRGRRLAAARLRYVERRSPDEADELDLWLEDLSQGSIIFHGDLGFGEVYLLNDEFVYALFSGEKAKFPVPAAFYDETISPVNATPALRAHLGFGDPPDFSKKKQQKEEGLDDVDPPKPKTKERTFRKPCEGGCQAKVAFGVGSLVRHEIYGTGTVVVFKPPIMNVLFRRKETKNFSYPDALDSGALVEVERDIDGKAKPAPKRKPSKGPKLRVKNGKLVCPECGFVSKPGDNVFWCPRCAERG